MLLTPALCDRSKENLDTIFLSSKLKIMRLRAIDRGIKRILQRLFIKLRELLRYAFLPSSLHHASFPIRADLIPQVSLAEMNREIFAIKHIYLLTFSL